MYICFHYFRHFACMCFGAVVMKTGLMRIIACIGDVKDCYPQSCSKYLSTIYSDLFIEQK